MAIIPLNFGTVGGGGEGSSAITVIDTPDEHGGTIREIIAVDISKDTVSASTLLKGITAHDRYGDPVTGTHECSGTPVLQSKTATPSESTQYVTADSGYDGLSDVTVNPIPSSYIIPSGSKSISSNGTYDVTSFASAVVNVSGGGSPTLQTKTVTPTESEQTVTADSGYDGLSSVTVEAIDDEYIGSGVTQRSSSDLTASGATVTAPAGYYEEAASKSVASGSAGTPTATKGTVSNHSVTVTPSVTNTAGYISGGTKTGTGVSVSASELVSGTKTISANGTSIDVTNYASVDVAVPSGAPNLQDVTKSYTPSETAQSETITAGTGYDGLGEVSVSVGAISSTYVGSGISRRSSTNLSVSGATVTAPAGYYEEAASKSVASGSATTPATTVSVTPSISVSSSGLITATASGTKSVTPSVSAGYVSSGTAGTITVSGSNTSQLTTQGATTYNTSSSDQTIASGTYLTGTQTIRAVTYSGLSAGNIASGVTVKIGDSADDDRIASVTGTLSFATYYTGSGTPSSSQGSNGDIYLQTS